MKCLKCHEKSRSEICDACLINMGIETEPRDRTGLLLGSVFLILFCIILAQDASALKCSQNAFYFTCRHTDHQFYGTLLCNEKNGCLEKAYPWLYKQLQRDPRSCFFNARLFIRELSQEDDVVRFTEKVKQRW